MRISRRYTVIAAVSARFTFSLRKGLETATLMKSIDQAPHFKTRERNHVKSHQKLLERRRRSNRSRVRNHGCSHRCGHHHRCHFHWKQCEHRDVRCRHRFDNTKCELVDATPLSRPVRLDPFSILAELSRMTKIRDKQNAVQLVK